MRKYTDTKKLKSIKGKDPKERLIKARMQLLMHFPFFGELVMRMVLHESRTAGVGTTCVDHKGNMYYHPEWINGMVDVEEVMFELAHEVMHLVQRASIRFPNGGNHMVWNIAADIKVDSILVDSGLKQSRVSMKNITQELMDKHRGQTTEQIYYHLLKNPDEVKSFGGCPHGGQSGGDCGHKPPGQEESNEDQNGNDKGQGKENQGDESEQEGQDQSQDGSGSGMGESEQQDQGHDQTQGDGQGPGGSCSQCGPRSDGQNAVGERGCISGALHDNPGSAEDIEKFKQYVIAAALASKGKGKHPAFADEFLAEIRKPSVTWKDLLRRASTSVFKGRYSFARRSRRSHNTPMMLPSRTRTPNGAIIMIDTSGSISDEDLTQFVSECSGILKETGCKFLKIYFHDVMCYHIEEYDLNTINKIKATRGGTSHIDVFNKVNDSLRSDKVGMVVAFTDLYTDFPEKPSYPVLWAHPEEHGDGVPVPWGKKVEVKLTS